MTLQNEKTQLELSKAKLQDAISDSEIKAHKSELRINELEYTARLAEEKMTYAFELKIRDLTHQHEENVKQLQNQYRSELEETLERFKDEYKKKYKEEKNSMRSALQDKEAELERILTCERAASKEKLESTIDLYNQNLATLEQQKKNLEKENRSIELERNDYKLKLETLSRELDSAKSSLIRYQSDTESSAYSFQTQIHELQMKLQQQTESMSSMELAAHSIQEEREIAKQKLLRAEAARRKLHNQLQELKGNIRVFCRVRPLLPQEAGPVNFNFPDCDEEGQQLQLQVPAIGGIPTLDQEVRNSVHSFKFDRVFSTDASNEDVFDEVEQLVQSALDGYNVCIFAYGQTGSGKTYTMSSPTNGIIPLAISQIFENATALEENGWEFEYHGEFLEIYNEKILDLLGKSDDLDKGKFEIRHDPTTRRTVVTGLTTVMLESPAQAATILQKASRNRSVAATMANHHSSRSHSVFILRLTGRNKVTGKTHNGVLNLIDLAGSERLSQSQAAGDRLKETQAINKSLSSLGDVICALGNKKDSHVPYRNSKVSTRKSKRTLDEFDTNTLAHLSATILP